MKVSVNFFCKKNTSAKEVKSICNFPTAKHAEIGCQSTQIVCYTAKISEAKDTASDTMKVRKLSIDET